MINPMDLTGKKVVITGAGGGIGKVTSEQLSRLGAQLVLLDVFPDRLEQTLGALEGACRRNLR